MSVTYQRASGARKISAPTVQNIATCPPSSPPTTRRSSLASSVDSAHSVTTKPRSTVRNSTTLSVTNEVSKTRTEYAEGILVLQDSIGYFSEKDSACEVMCVRFSPDGTAIAAGYANGTIKIYSVDTGTCVQALANEDSLKAPLPVTSIRFMPLVDQRKHLLMATYATGDIRFWHYSSGKCMSTLNEQRLNVQTMSSALSPGSDRLATVGADPQIHIYDVQTRKRITTLEATDSRDKMDGHRARVFAVQYHPNEPHVFLTGGWDNTVQYWDDRARHSFRKFFGPHICGDALDIDPIYNHILTGSWRKDAPLQIWDFVSGDKIKDVPEDLMHASQLYCAQWLGREHIVCGGCTNNMARVIDRGTLNTVGQLVELPQGVYCLDNDRQAKPRIAVGAANKLYLLRTVVPSATN